MRTKDEAAHVPDLTAAELLRTAAGNPMNGAESQAEADRDCRTATHPARRLPAAWLGVGLALVLGGCGMTPPPVASQVPQGQIRPTTPIPTTSPDGGPSQPATPGPKSAGRVISTTLLPQDGLGVAGFAVDGGDVWVTDSGPAGGEVLLIRDGAIKSQFPVGWAPGSIAVDKGTVWVSETIGDGSRPAARQNAVVGLDTRTGGELTQTPVPLPGKIVVINGAPWVASGDGSSVPSAVLRLDPSTGAITSRVPINGSITDMAVILGSLWVASASTDAAGGWLSRIGPIDGRLIASQVLPDRPAGVAAVGEALWVALPGADSSTIRELPLDSTGAAVQGPPLDTPLLVGRMAADGDWLWIANDGSLVRLAAQGLHGDGGPVGLPSATGPTILGLIATPSGIWVLGSGALVRIERA